MNSRPTKRQMMPFFPRPHRPYNALDCLALALTWGFGIVAIMIYFGIGAR